MSKNKKRLTAREKIRRKAQSYSTVTGTPIDPMTNRPIIGFIEKTIPDAPLNEELQGCSIYAIDIR